MIKTSKIKIKIKQTKLANKYHFDVQRRTKATIFIPKKGKGSYQRTKLSTHETEKE